MDQQDKHTMSHDIQTLFDRLYLLICYACIVLSRVVLRGYINKYNLVLALVSFAQHVDFSHAQRTITIIQHFDFPAVLEVMACIQQFVCCSR